LVGAERDIVVINNHSTSKQQYLLLVGEEEVDLVELASQQGAKVRIDVVRPYSRVLRHIQDLEASKSPHSCPSREDLHEEDVRRWQLKAGMTKGVELFWSYLSADEPTERNDILTVRNVRFTEIVDYLTQKTLLWTIVSY
jgi:hypothetical protein